MCATVPTIPLVLMVPLTDLSAAMVMVPVPVAVVVTGGVSSAPTNVTLRSTANDAPQNAMKPAAATSERTRTLLIGLLTRGLLAAWALGYPAIIGPIYLCVAPAGGVPSACGA